MRLIGKWKGNYLVCLEFSFRTAVTTLPSVRVLIQMCFVANRGKNCKFQKLHYSFGTRLWFKKDKLFSENKCSSLHVLTRTTCTSGLKKCFKGNLHNQENGDISIFAFPLATVPLVACIFLHLWTSTCQVSLCRYKNVVNEIKRSQLKNCLVLLDLKNTIGWLDKKM